MIDKTLIVNTVGFVERFHASLVQLSGTLRPAILRLGRGHPKSIGPRGVAYRRRQLARGRR
jgi:hypothetical protein